MSKLNRREFIRTSSAVTAGALAAGGKKFVLAAEQEAPATPSANDHIQIALIGAGSQGQGDAFEATQVPGAKLVAVADFMTHAWSIAKSALAPTSRPPSDYHEILARQGH